MSKFKAELAELTEEEGLIRLTKNGNGFCLLAASFSGTNVPPGTLPVKEVLIDLPRKSKREFVFVREGVEDAQIIILEWIQRWPDEDDEKATGHEMIPFAFIDPPKDIRPGKKIMYSIIEDTIYLRVKNSFLCSSEAIARARKFRYVPAEAIIKYILSRVTLADLGMIARGADKKEAEQLRRENRNLRSGRDEASKKIKHVRTALEQLVKEKTILETELCERRSELKTLLFDVDWCIGNLEEILKIISETGIFNFRKKSEKARGLLERLIIEMRQASADAGNK